MILGLSLFFYSLLLNFPFLDGINPTLIGGWYVRFFLISFFFFLSGAFGVRLSIFYALFVCFLYSKLSFLWG